MSDDALRAVTIVCIYAMVCCFIMFGGWFE